MASITKVGNSWRALIRRKGHKTLCKTFQNKAQAEVWARQRESEIDRGEIVAEAGAVTISELIREYRDMRDHSRPISDSSTEHYTLRRLDQTLGDKRASSLSAQDLVGFAVMRKEDGAGPYTINCDIGKLGTVMRFAGAALKLKLPDAVGQARPLLAHLNLIGGGGKRERRPDEDELPRIIAWLDESKGLRYADAAAFAAMTAMRRGEICEIKWPDVDSEKRMVLVRDRKHPRKKIGNNEWIPLLGESWDLLQRQEKAEGDDRIFPIHPQTLSKYFKQACDALSIVDLHFHDLRHEGASRMFEQGFDIPEVALVTGHKDWRNLRRYTNLRPEDLHKKT